MATGSRTGGEVAAIACVDAGNAVLIGYTVPKSAQLAQFMQGAVRVMRTGAMERLP